MSWNKTLHLAGQISMNHIWGNARISVFNYFNTSCKFLIIHDVDYLVRNGYWGKIDKTERKGSMVKHDMDFSDICNHYLVHYPSWETWPRNSETGPPTLLCSNDPTVDAKFFTEVRKSISYYFKLLHKKLNLNYYWR